MKRFTIISIILLTFTGLSVEAQNLNRIQRGQRGYSPQARPIEAGEPEKPDVNIMSQEQAQIYAEDLGLDAFQKEVLKNYLKDYYTARVNINYDPDLKRDDKIELVNAEHKKFEKELTAVFSEEQVLQILIKEQDPTAAKKDKKKRKKKRKQNKEEDNG